MESNIAAIQNLPFGFAKRYGVFLQFQDDSPDPVLCYQDRISPTAYAEVRRFLTSGFVCKQLQSNEFDSLLAAAYERDSSEAMQMVEDLGEEIDLASLANAVQETEDLMERSCYSASTGSCSKQDVPACPSRR